MLTSNTILRRRNEVRGDFLKRLSLHCFFLNKNIYINFRSLLSFLQIIVKLLGRRFQLLFGIIIISVYQYLLRERNLQVLISLL